MNGVAFVGLAIPTAVVYGVQPGVAASSDELVAFYGGSATRVLLAAVFAGLNTLNLVWFVAALRTTLADIGQDGWSSAATAAGAAIAVPLFLAIIIVPPSRTRSPARPTTP